MNSKIRVLLAALFAVSIIGCGDGAKDSGPKIVGTPQNTEFSGPVSDGPTGAGTTPAASSDKMQNTP